MDNNWANLYEAGNSLAKKQNLRQPYGRNYDYQEALHSELRNQNNDLNTRTYMEAWNKGINNEDYRKTLPKKVQDMMKDGQTMQGFGGFGGGNEDKMRRDYNNLITLNKFAKGFYSTSDEGKGQEWNSKLSDKPFKHHGSTNKRNAAAATLKKHMEKFSHEGLGDPENKITETNTTTSEPKPSEPVLGPAMSNTLAESMAFVDAHNMSQSDQMKSYASNKGHEFKFKGSKTQNGPSNTAAGNLFEETKNRIKQTYLQPGAFDLNRELI